MPALEPPRDLTIPEPGSTTARAVLSLALRRVMRGLQTLQPTGANVAADHQRTMTEVARVARDAPGLLAAIVRRPNVSALLRTLRSDSRAPIDRPAVGRELRGTLLAELAAAGAIAHPVELQAPQRLVLLGARVAHRAPDRATRLRVGPGWIEWLPGPTRLPLDAPTGEFHHIAGPIVLATADNNPLSMFEAHPHKSGNAIDLGGQPAERWVAVLRECLSLVAEHLPELREEMDLFIHQIVPVGHDERTHLSASYQEAIGTIYMTLHPQLMTMVEATIHEFQHNKLHALLELDPLLHNAYHPLYRSPVRPDPRPLQGVLLAVHAFLPVARLYERMAQADHPRSRSPEFQRRLDQIRAKNRDGADVLLEHASPTIVGQALLDEIGRLSVRRQPGA